MVLVFSSGIASTNRIQANLLQELAKNMNIANAETAEALLQEAPAIVVAYKDLEKQWKRVVAIYK